MTRAENNLKRKLRQRKKKKITLDYLPCFQGEFGDKGTILSSSNGLLLCYNRFVEKKDKFYYLRNPFTKQWSSIPPPPDDDISLRSSSNGRVVGFVCDPNYDHLNLNPTCCRYRILCAYIYPLHNGGSKSKLDVDIFSSETGQWTTRTITRLGGYWDSYHHFPPKRVISCKGKGKGNGKGKLYVQVGQSILVYDPYTFKLEADIDPPKENLFFGITKSDLICEHLANGSYKRYMDVDPPAQPNQVVDCMEGFSCCRGSLWTCQLRKETKTLYIWRLKEEEDSNKWSLEKKVRLECTTELANKCMARRTNVRVLTLHPDDPNMVYLILPFCGLIVLWNSELGTLEVAHQSPPKTTTLVTMLFSYKSLLLFQARIP